MGKDKAPKSFVLHRLRGDVNPKPLVFTRIKTGGKSSSLSSMRDRFSVLCCLDEGSPLLHPFTYEVRFHLEVKTNRSLKAKICTLVITSCEASSNSKGKIKEEK